MSQDSFVQYGIGPLSTTLRACCRGLRARPGSAIPAIRGRASAAIKGLADDSLSAVISPAGLFLLLLPRPPGGRPSLFSNLVRPRYSQRTRRHVLGDARAGAHISSVFEGYRRDQRGVAAHKNSLADARLVLVDSVVVAGDDPGADVRSGPDLGIAQVGQVAGLGALAHLCLLGFDKVADMSVFADFASGPQMRKGPDSCALGHGAFRQNATLANQHVIAQRAVLDYGIGADM